MSKFRVVTPKGASFTVAGGGYAYEKEALDPIGAEIIEAPANEVSPGRYRVTEVPVVWRHVEQSKVSPGRDAALMLWDVVKLSAKRRLRRRP